MIRFYCLETKSKKVTVFNCKDISSAMTWNIRNQWNAVKHWKSVKGSTVCIDIPWIWFDKNWLLARKLQDSISLQKVCMYQGSKSHEMLKLVHLIFDSKFLSPERNKECTLWQITGKHLMLKMLGSILAGIWRRCRSYTEKIEGIILWQGFKLLWYLIGQADRMKHSRDPFGIGCHYCP